MSISLVEREKGRDPTQSYDKDPYTDGKIQKATWQHKDATKNFDYTTIADRLRPVSWGNDSQLTGSQPSHSPQQLCNRGHEHADIILQLAEIWICIVSKKDYWKDVLRRITC